MLLPCKWNIEQVKAIIIFLKQTWKNRAVLLSLEEDYTVKLVEQDEKLVIKGHMVLQ